MKLDKKNIQLYFDYAGSDIVEEIKNRLKKFYDEYKEMKFGKSFFLDIEVRNVLCDLIWYRDKRFKTHLQICRQMGIDKETFAIKHIETYQRWLKDIELKSFIQIIRQHETWFGYSEEEQKKMNDELCRIAKEVIAEMELE